MGGQVEDLMIVRILLKPQENGKMGMVRYDWQEAMVAVMKVWYVR